MRGQAYAVDFWVSASGAADSVEVRGSVEPEYAPRLRAALRQYRFRTAIYLGCAVPGTYNLSVTFGR
jgi:hypothetical protein